MESSLKQSVLFSMEKGVIITLPRHDDVTEYLSLYSYQIEENAKANGINFKKIEDAKANKKEFERVAEKLKYKVVIFNGHGSAEVIGGYKNEPIIKLGDNDSILKERIVYARSCHAASALGVECAKNNKEGCFVGYDRPFQFYINNLWTGNPLKDNTARLFLEPSNLVPISIIKGNSANFADKNSKKGMLKNIKRILKNKDNESFLIAEALWNNYEGQVVLGNKEAKI